MPDKIITLEDQRGPFRDLLQRIMHLVPEKDQQDKNLQRLIAFCLKSDGEVATREYLIRKIEEIIACDYTGSLYNFLKDDLEEKECHPEGKPPDPPVVA